MITFETPGLIDPRAFTTGGLSAKQHDNPIGRFGTGLKYAIAVLVRMGIEPKVFIGHDEYSFVKKPIDFRGKEFDLIVMRLKKWNWRKTREYEMPFTTEYGKHWELWQVYRELEANTRDEKGMTTSQELLPSRNNTQIVIDDSRFDAVWAERDKVFLPDRTPIRTDVGIEMYEGEAQHLYFRGMRVLDLQKPSQYTWNFTREMDLTEDRSLRYEFQARMYVAEFVTVMQDRDFIKKMVTSKEKFWESSMDFTYATSRVSTEWRSVARERPSDMLRSARSWADIYEPEPVEHVDEFKRPWIITLDTGLVTDTDGRPVLQMETEVNPDWLRYGEKIIELMNKDAE